MLLKYVQQVNVNGELNSPIVTVSEEVGDF